MIFTAAAVGPVQAKEPDLSGVWGRDVHNYPKPYLAPGRGGGITNGYNNEYLKPWVVEALRRDDLVTESGHGVVTSHSVCYPEGVPYAYGGSVIQILQRPTEITEIFADHSQWRNVRMNGSHPKALRPSWWGDSVGHFEDDTLVVDTVGIAVRPEAGSMGNYGTPHSQDLHLVEKIRFLRPGETSTAPKPHDDTFSADDVIPNGKVLRVTFTLEDPIAYKKPWSVTLDYLPLKPPIKEFVCAENSRNWDLGPLLPTAPKPDF